MSVEVEVSIKADSNEKKGSETIINAKSEPLKIPLPKSQQNNNYLRNINGSPSISSTNNSSSFGDSKIAEKTEKQLILNCDSPQIFSLKDDVEVVDDGDKKESNKDKTENSNENNTHSTTGTGSGVSSSYNSEMNSANDEGSPFYSSDIDSDTSSEPPLLWNFADYFANIPGNDWCVRIPQCFIEDEFNLFELPDVFRCPLTLTDSETTCSKSNFEEYTFDDLIDFITIEDLTEDPIPKISKEMLEDSILLYKLIHQRFIMTKSGLQAMWEKFEQQTYGTCPRYYCHDQPLLPVGPSAIPGEEAVKVYCLHCQDLYEPNTQRHAKMDGVPFGPSFAHFFVRTLLYANETKAIENRRGPHDWQTFIPKIYGFKIHREGQIFGIRSDRPKDFK